MDKNRSKNYLFAGERCWPLSNTAFFAYDFHPVSKLTSSWNASVGTRTEAQFLHGEEGGAETGAAGTMGYRIHRSYDNMGSHFEDEDILRLEILSRGFTIRYYLAPIAQSRTVFGRSSNMHQSETGSARLKLIPLMRTSSSNELKQHNTHDSVLEPETKTEANSFRNQVKYIHTCEVLVSRLPL